MSWAESLFKGKQIPSLRSSLFSSLCHGQLEEIAVKGKAAFVLGLNHLLTTEHSSTITGNNHLIFKELNQWNKEREKILKVLLKKKEIPFLFLNFTMNRSFLMGYLIALFYQIIYGVGKHLKVDIYNQPQVDSYKKLFYN